MRWAALCAALLLLGGCHRSAPEQVTADTLAPVATRAPVPGRPLGPAIDPAAPTTTSAAPLSEADKGELGARKVLQAWGRALEARDYDGAYALWGQDAHTRSGMDATENRQWWARFKTINVAANAGRIEGAAGSSYYSAPVAVTGKLRNGVPYRLEGTITLRRVNDVPGATADQLHWHLDKVDFHPVS